MKWIGEIERQREIMMSKGYTARYIAESLSDKFNVNVTKDMVSSRARAVRMRLESLERLQQINNGVIAADDSGKVPTEQVTSIISPTIHGNIAMHGNIVSTKLLHVAEQPLKPTTEEDFMCSRKLKTIQNSRCNNYNKEDLKIDLSAIDKIVNKSKIEELSNLINDSSNLKTDSKLKSVELEKLEELENINQEILELDNDIDQDKYVIYKDIKQNLKDIWEKFNDNKPKKILSLSDLHSPFIDFTAIKYILDKERDCSICVLNGDIFDGQCMSKFDKLDEIDLIDEFQPLFKLLDILSKRFETVIWVGGNHDWNRFIRHIANKLSPGMRKFAFNRLNPIKYMVEKYDNIISVNHNMCQIGDVIFKHPCNYSSVELRTVINELDILQANRYDLPNPNFRAILIGHTHDMGKFYKNDVLCMEQGCLTTQQDYRYEKPTKRKWSIGYATIELNSNNQIMFNNTDCIYLGSV